MIIELKVYNNIPCGAELFSINTVIADVEDFGSITDHSPDTAEDYGCGNMQFSADEMKPEILSKYGISVEEWKSLVTLLEDTFDIGACGCCV